MLAVLVRVTFLKRDSDVFVHDHFMSIMGTKILKGEPEKKWCPETKRGVNVRMKGEGDQTF